MKTPFAILISLLISSKPLPLFAEISTSDISLFWQAVDLLPDAKNYNDSISVIQQNYIDKVSDNYSSYIKRSNITAAEYVRLLKKYPNYWKQIRPLTEKIASRNFEVEKVLAALDSVIPAFKKPDVCFAIGCLRQGGTTKGNLVIVGAEMAAASPDIDTSELSPWLKSVIGKTGDIVAMVAHESIHIQQTGFPVNEFFSLLKHKQLTLYNMAILEGSCDYITRTVLSLNINENIYDYGMLHECDLYTEFLKSGELDAFDYSDWLYNGNIVKDKPADLGYFIGLKITEAYFKNEPNSKKAYNTIFKRGKYKKVMRIAAYDPVGCN